MGFVPFSPPTLSSSINRANSNSLCPYPAHLDHLRNRARLFYLVHTMYFCRVDFNLTIFLCSAYTGATNELTVATSVAINWIQFDTAEMRVMNRTFNRIVIANQSCSARTKIVSYWSWRNQHRSRSTLAYIVNFTEEIDLRSANWERIFVYKYCFIAITKL